MDPLLRLAYRGIARAATAATSLAGGRHADRSSDTSPKWLRALTARKDLLARYRSWGTAGRDRSRPLLWLHAPSVGEALQARAVIELVRAERPQVQIAFTFFSPSAERFSRTLLARNLVDFADYLPFDAPHTSAAALDALTPTALVFSKLDVWPELVDQAAARGVRLGLVSGTLSATSGRRSPLARAILRDAYARLDTVGAIAAEDADRLADLGVKPTRIRVTGDTRYDQVWSMAGEPAPPAVANLASPTFTIVAGSTWPADERVLLPAWPSHAMRLIIAPHEPTPAHMEPIEDWCRSCGVAMMRLSDANIGMPLVIVDSVGVLAPLYAIGDVAYVGGGFHAAGLHSVLEPAAHGVPVIVGPRHEGSRDAGLLLQAGGARTVKSSEELRAIFMEWQSDDAARRQAGEAAKAVVRQGLGAARRSFELVTELMDGV